MSLLTLIVLPPCVSCFVLAVLCVLFQSTVIAYPTMFTVTLFFLVNLNLCPQLSLSVGLIILSLKLKSNYYLEGPYISVKVILYMQCCIDD